MASNGHTNGHGDGREAQPAQKMSALRFALYNFSSQWFLLPQGTGILSIILHQLDYQFRGLAIISQILWVLTIVLLLGFLVIYLARTCVFPAMVRQQLQTNIMETACLSSISIAFTTIIQMIVLNVVREWSRGWGVAALGLWWINTALATIACIGIPYILATLEAPGIDSLQPSILLPAISALTLAAGGGVICRYGELNASLQLPVIVVSYLAIGMALPLSLACIAIFLARFTNKSWPVGHTAYSLMLLCGPFGQGSFALQILGDCVQRTAFYGYNTSSFLHTDAGKIVATSSELLGLLTWGFGTFWWAFACIALVHYFVVDRKSMMGWDQDLGFWSIVFPWVSETCFLGEIEQN